MDEMSSIDPLTAGTQLATPSARGLMWGLMKIYVACQHHSGFETIGQMGLWR